MTDEYEQIPEIFEATHTGYLEIVGSNKIYCAVLKNGKRVISQTALFKAFDRPRKATPSGYDAKLIIYNLIRYKNSTHYLQSKLYIAITKILIQRIKITLWHFGELIII